MGLTASMGEHWSTVAITTVAVIVIAVIAFVGEPSRPSEAAVERPIIATDAVCFGLVVTDVAVAAPVRRLDPPSLFPSGVGWDVERGAITETALGTFLVGWEPSSDRGDIEINFAVLRPSGRPFSSASSQEGLRRFSASTRLGVDDPFGSQVRVIAGTNEAYVTVHEPGLDVLHVIRLAPDRISGSGNIDPERDVISIRASVPGPAVGATRVLWLTEVAPPADVGHRLTAIAFGGPDGPVAVTAVEQLGGPHLTNVGDAVVGQVLDGALGRWEFRGDVDPMIERTDVHPLPGGVTGRIAAASMRGSSVPSVAIANRPGEVAIMSLEPDGRPTTTRVLALPEGVDQLQGVLAGPAMAGLISTVEGELQYWIAGANDDALAAVSVPGDACSIRNDAVAQRILAPVAGGDLVFLHYPDRQADCVINLPKGPECIKVDRSTGGIPRPNLAAISALQRPDLEFNDSEALTEERATAPDNEPDPIEEIGDVELDLVGESVTSDPCDIIDPARVLTDGRPEITSIQAEGEGFALAWWWNTTDDGCVPSGYEFVRVSGGTCSATWPSSSSDRLTIHVDLERTGFSTVWAADPGEGFAVWVRGLVDGQESMLGNVDCRRIHVPVAVPPDPSSFSAGPSGGNWSLSWGFSCAIAASCGGERFEVTMEFCSGSVRQSFTTAETSLKIPIDDSLVGQLVKFSVVTLRDGNGETLRSGAASVGCSQSVRPPRDGSPGDITLAALASGNLQLHVDGDARSELVKLLGTSQLDGLTVEASRSGASASGSVGFSGGALSADLGTPLCFGSAWSVSFAVGGRSISSGNHTANCNTAITGQSLTVAGSGTTLTYMLTVDGLADDIAAGAAIGSMSVKCGSREASGSPNITGDEVSLTLDAAGCLTVSSLSAAIAISYPGDAPDAKPQASTNADGSALQAIFATNQKAIAQDYGLNRIADSYDADADLRTGFPRSINAFSVDITLEPGCDGQEDDDHPTEVIVTVTLGPESQSYTTTVTCIAVVADDQDEAEDDDGEQDDEDRQAPDEGAEDNQKPAAEDDEDGSEGHEPNSHE